MTLRHFEIFKTVAEMGNFTKAAEKLYISQSGVSHAIRDLEEKAGTALFDRLSKSVCLTESGRLLLQEIIPILSSCNALNLKINCLEQKAPLRIISSITIASFWLPSILLMMKKEWPDTPVEVEVVNAANAIGNLSLGKADVALIEGIPPQGPFLSIPFSSYKLTVVCAPEYLLNRRTLTIQELCLEKLLLREKGSAIRDTVDSALYLAGYTVRPLWTSVNSLALIQAAKAGIGITILPDILIKDEIEKGTLIPLTIENIVLKNELIMIRHRDKYISEPLATFLSCVQKCQVIE